VIETQITDHRAVAISISKVNFERTESPLFMEKTMLDYSKLNLMLMCHDWNEVLFSHDVDVKFSTFLKVLNNYIDQSKYIKSYKSSKKLKPWMTDGLAAAINNRDKLFKKIARNPLDTKLKREYLTYKKKIVFWVKEQKNKYYSNLNVLPIKQQWKEINKLCGQSPSRRQSISLKIGETTVFDEQLIANNFNEYFIQSPIEIASSVDSLNETNRLLYRTRFTSNFSCKSIFFEPIYYNEIHTVINSLKNGKSPGPDNISSDLIKAVSASIIPVLCDIFNFSISVGQFPEEMKIAKVVPIYKKGSKTDISNYRPVSLLSVFSK
jgi:hypothetical protein